MVDLIPSSGSLILTIWSETFTPVAYWRWFYRGIAVLFQFLLAHASLVASLMAFNCPVQLYLCNSPSPAVSMLLRLCGKTQQTFLQAHVWMLHPRSVGLPVQCDSVAGIASCYRHVTDILENTNVYGHYMCNLSLFVGSLVFTFPTCCQFHLPQSRWK